MSSEPSFNKEAEQTILTFLKSNVSKSDVDNIELELKKNFKLSKTKGKNFKKNPKKKKKLCLSRKEKKALGFYTISRTGMNYSDFVPMNRIWTEYMEQVLDLSRSVPDYTSKNWEMFSQSFYKADFHGSILTVTRSKCPSYVDKTGICIMDTKQTFKIISINNVVTTIPKKESVFTLHLKNMKITLFGKHLCIRPAERSTKKFKGHFYPDI